MSVKTLIILTSALAGIAAMAGGPCAADNDPAAKIFNTYCTPCHGETGRGNGPNWGHSRQKAAKFYRLRSDEEAVG